MKSRSHTLKKKKRKKKVTVYAFLKGSEAGSWKKSLTKVYFGNFYVCIFLFIYIYLFYMQRSLVLGYDSLPST